MQNQRYMYYDYNDTSMTYINANMAMLRVRNHYMIISNKVLDNKTRLVHYPSTL